MDFRWLKPGLAQPKPGPGQILEIWGPGNPESWGPKNQKKILEIEIRSAQNVGKVWISRKKSSWLHLGQSQAIFPWTGKKQKHKYVVAIFLGGPMGPIHPVWALFHCLMALSLQPLIEAMAAISLNGYE